jgi:hypothetical protein
MKTHTNDRGPKWTKYYEDCGCRTPIVKHHVTGKITLMSPSNDEEKVDIYTPEENLFIFDTFRRIAAEWFGLETFRERYGDLIIEYSRTTGLSVRRRGVHETQFHCVTNQSVEFIVDALKLIEAQRTAS